MLNSQEVEKNLLNAHGVFEYTVDGGSLIAPAYKYTYFLDMGDRTTAILLGRGADNAIRETGVYLDFKYGREFWGDDVSIGGDVEATYFYLGERWEGKAGSVTGIVNVYQKAVYIEFDFVAHRNSLSKHIKGYCILEANNASLSGGSV